MSFLHVLDNKKQACYGIRTWMVSNWYIIVYKKVYFSLWAFGQVEIDGEISSSLHFFFLSRQSSGSSNPSGGVFLNHLTFNLAVTTRILPLLALLFHHFATVRTLCQEYSTPHIAAEELGFLKGRRTGHDFKIFWVNNGSLKSVAVDSFFDASSHRNQQPISMPKNAPVI